eukprot:576400-Prorocentrum_minimum.AAC.2
MHSRCEALNFEENPVCSIPSECIRRPRPLQLVEVGYLLTHSVSANIFRIGRTHRTQTQDLWAACCAGPEPAIGAKMAANFQRTCGECA